MSIRVFGLAACVILFAIGCGKQTTGVPSVPQPIQKEAMNEELALSRAKEVISKLGYDLPDKEMMDALAKVGVAPTVVPMENGWRITYPGGHPWAYSVFHLELDQAGQVVRFEARSGT